jgi:DNA-binding LytR/AlgR family response regulator
MKKYNVFVVEDDPESLKRLTTLLKPYDSLFDLTNIVIATSFVEAQQCLVQSNGFDISILDKNLDEGETCFSLITEKNVAKFGLFVFNTIEKSDAALLEKLKVSGGHLVLGKPYTEKTVATVMDEISSLLGKKTILPTLEIDCITVKDKTGYKVLHKHNIVALVISGNYANFHYLDDKNKVIKINESGQLHDYPTLVNDTQFQQIHRGTVINTKYVTEIFKTDRYLHLRGIEQPFDISESYIEVLKKRGMWP